MSTAPEDVREDPYAHDTLTWEPLRLLTFYRLILAGLLTVLYFSITDSTLLGIQHPRIYAVTCIAYLAFSLVAGFTTRLRKPGYELQAVTQVLTDIAVISLLIFTSGGLASSLGVLLIISVASGSILLPGRMAFLFAAVASIAVMGGQVYSSLLGESTRTTGYTQAGLLGIALFATAALTYLLVRRIHESEALARRRGIDVANLSRLNALIVQRLQAGIIVTDHEHRIHLINETARKLLGLPPSATGQPLATLSPALFKRLENWRRTHDQEPALLKDETTAVNVLAHFTRLGTVEGIGALIFLEDTAIMAKQAQQMKLASLGRLTASIAHEIRNPLGAISHAAQLLDESQSLDDGDRRLTTIIGDQTRRVNTVLENVLQLSRPGTSMPQHFRLHDWLEKFTDEFTHSGSCPEEQISIEGDPADMEVYMDPSLLHQVVWNLCQNAVRHAGREQAGFRLKLTGSRSGSSRRPQLDIIDNGTGIEPDMADKIFEPFFTTRSSGTGLGLYIAREICESNQATLTYVPAPGGGSCFRITFPDSEGLSVAALA
jgi:two-component system sensor histidine kinase PilS (NtrC family)